MACVVSDSFASLLPCIPFQPRAYAFLESCRTPFLIEAVFIHYRRSMLGIIKDPTAQMLALVITGLEEALMRCTMMSRDSFMRWLLGTDDLSKEQQELEREIWALVRVPV